MSDNPFDQIRQAVSVAEMQFRAVDNAAGQMARLLRGRLKHVDPWVLRELKRELAAFDAHRRRWTR